jgi:TPP-dependent pyruvate/acetoin dehydrogenase alpha subunit
MKRYRAFDPPEYVRWSPDPELMSEYRARLRADAERWQVIRELDGEKLLDLYRGLVRFRLHDIALQRWVKQGVISKAWLATGEEAVTIGSVHALRRQEGGDIVGPMIRNAGACHEMGMQVSDMLKSYLGTCDAPSRGRDLHFGDAGCGVVAPVSMVGALCTVMNGYALACMKRGEDRVALTWIGDGSTKSGEVHEALNFAAVLKLPIVFVLQNNQVALGTRLQQHHRAPDFAGWGRAYGVPLLSVDGNNVLDVHAAAVIAVLRCRRGRGPVMIAAETFRMGGHATHDVREARMTLDPGLFDAWGRRDPIGMYEEYLAQLHPPVGSDLPAAASGRALLRLAEEEVTREVDEAAERALASRRTRLPRPDAQAEESCYG